MFFVTLLYESIERALNERNFSKGIDAFAVEFLLTASQAFMATSALESKNSGKPKIVAYSHAT